MYAPALRKVAPRLLPSPLTHPLPPCFLPVSNSTRPPSSRFIAIHQSEHDALAFIAEFRRRCHDGLDNIWIVKPIGETHRTLNKFGRQNVEGVKLSVFGLGFAHLMTACLLGNLTRRFAEKSVLAYALA